MNKVIDILKKLDFEKERIDTTIDKFEKYMEGILYWNKKVNLTSITDKDQFIEKHFYDSLLPALSTEFKNSHLICDLGTGGGFPGIPLAVAFPDKKFTLIDSLKKRLNIIDSLCKDISIDNVTTVHGRAEDLAKHGSGYREYFDLCVSRAVADLPVLSEYCIPFVKPGGYFIAFKSSGSDELERSENAISLLGGEVVKHEFADNGHSLIFINKVSSTPEKYPRLPGKPSKKPL